MARRVQASAIAQVPNRAPWLLDLLTFAATCVGLLCPKELSLHSEFAFYTFASSMTLQNVDGAGMGRTVSASASACAASSATAATAASSAAAVSSEAFAEARTSVVRDDVQRRAKRGTLPYIQVDVASQRETASHLISVLS